MEMEKEVEKKIVRHETTPSSGAFEEYTRYFTMEGSRRKRSSAEKEQGVFSRYG